MIPALGNTHAVGRLIEAREFGSSDTVGHARWLLGKVLVRTRAGISQASLITEVEAYDSEKDLACHASKGRTRRTDVLYAAGGVWYVYFVYGMHHMLNLVTGPENYPAAVLIRGLDSIAGPGRLTQRLGIDLGLNRAAVSPAAGLHLEDRGIAVPPRLMKATPRIGVDYAGPYWAGRKWRFQVDPQKLRTPS